MSSSGDEASLDDDEFVVPEDPLEQERFKRRLMATASSLKKNQQQLRVDQDLLADRWTEVLAAEEYELERPSKSYPKRKLLPRLEEEAYKPTSPAHNMADRPPRGRDREAFQPKAQPAPRATQIKMPRHGEIRQTCETHWRTKQNMKNQSTDHEGAPLCETINITPDTVKVNPAGSNTAGKTHSSCVAI